MGLRKAFNTINHTLLLQKLQHYGFRGQCFDYLKSYYINCKQYVNLNGHNSSLLPVTHGVPQGSILGPLCFNLFINDMPLAVDEVTVLFDDEGLYQKIDKLFSDSTTYLNINKLAPYSTKSKLMMFKSRSALELLDFSFYW